MRKAARRAILIGIAGTFIVGLSAQPATGIVNGTVRGAAGPIASARVVVDSASQSSYTAETKTGGDGRFAVADVPVGGVAVGVYDANEQLIATAKGSLRNAGDTITLLIQVP